MKPFCVNEQCSRFLPEDQRGYYKKKTTTEGAEGEPAGEPASAEKKTTKKAAAKKLAAKKYCEEYGLLSSGSSDLHSPDADTFAANCAPDSWLDEILERVTLYHGV